MTREQALRIRQIIEMAMASVEDKIASEAPTLFPLWETLLAEGRAFTQEDVDNRFRLCYGGKIYVVTQPHTIQEGWTPDAAVSLYETIDYVNGIRLIPEYITAENPFSEGEFGIDSAGVVWKSLVNNNVYTPTQYPANWEQQDS